MKILVDTNVILDVLFERKPFVNHSSVIMGKIERRTLGGMLCATTLTTIHYLACKSIGKKEGTGAIKKLLQIYEIAPVDHQILTFALNSGFKDYEDGVLHASAIKAGAVAIVTRNIKDFAVSELPVFTPEEFIFKSPDF
ncbi:PIN domain-containing protein [Endozoicomonas euniceicola]|uniref:PIN domain-containing protein n=1 Tax=Endozoicomonas euniceicola TaxID=1234143 RepID=A0ABY6H0H4_9GAMM|nr:PIN domain-containing protein [Endozoicomonas euniceicola]UYM18547.1 PIN domain-containing protein [Endozoicomonas euniceicola]